MSNGSGVFWSCRSNCIIRKAHSMLDEESVLLLGAAELLRRSDLLPVVVRFEKIHSDVPKM
jgi:hypothetical protein